MNLIMISGKDLPFSAIVNALRPLRHRMDIQEVDQSYDTTYGDMVANLPGADHDCDEHELRSYYGQAGHPKWTPLHWRESVAHHRTDLGYWAWVYSQTRWVESHPVEE